MVKRVVMGAGEPWMSTRHSGAARSAEPGIFFNNFEILRCATAHPSSLALPAPRNDAEGTPSLLGLARILDRLEGRELDVVELAIDLLDLADVDVLHDVAGIRIDRDRPARALPLHPLHRRDQLIAIGLAPRLLQPLIDQIVAAQAA